MLAIPSRHARASTGSAAAVGVVARGQGQQLRRALEVRLAVRPPQVRKVGQGPAVADRRQHVLQLAALGERVVDVVRDHDRQPQLGGQARRLRGEPVVVGKEVVRELEDEPGAGCPAARRRPLRPIRRGPGADRTAPRTAPPRARAPSRSPARSRRASSPCRHPDSATRPSACSASSACVNLGHRLRAREVRPRHQPAQAPPAGRVPRQQHEVRPALAPRRSPGGPPCGPRGGRAAGRAPGEGGPDGPPGREAAPGRTGGRPARLPRAPAPAPRSRPGPPPPASSSSISIPMTGCSPAASAAAENRTAPYRPWWSVIASPARPSSTARATRSSGADAPSRNEKWLWQCSSA